MWFKCPSHSRHIHILNLPVFIRHYNSRIILPIDRDMLIGRFGDVMSDLRCCIKRMFIVQLTYQGVAQ